MSARDAMQGGFDADAARYDRMNRTQPAQFAPGQEAVFQQQDAFAQSAVPNDPGAMGDIFSTGVGGAATGGAPMDAMNPFGQPGAGAPGMMASPNSMMPGAGQVQQKDAADQFWDAMAKAGKGSMNFIKAIMEASSKLTVRWYSEWGFLNMRIGLGIVGAGIILKMFGVSFGLSISAGGALTAAIGAFIWLFWTGAAKKCSSKYKDDNVPIQPAAPEIQSPVNDFGFGDTGGGDDFFGEGSDLFGEGGEDSGDDWGDDPYADDDPYAGLEAEEQAEPGMTADEALASLPEIPQGMYERNYLWEMFTKVLPTMEPGFSKMRTHEEDSETFL